MSFAQVNEMIEVNDLLESNGLINAGHELLQIRPGWTGDSTH
jgi:hypothetical protein